MDSIVMHNGAICGDGPLAATNKLSRNCRKATMLPKGRDHCKIPESVTERSPIFWSRCTSFLHIHTQWRSADWALKGPPMGMAPPRRQVSPLASLEPPPPSPRARTGRASHAWPADMQSRRDSHHAPPPGGL